MKQLIILALIMTVAYSAVAKTKKSPCSSVTTSGYYYNPAIANHTGYTVTQPAIPPQNYTRHHIKVWMDNMNNPYEGLPSRQNDGVKKNEMRNLNVTATSFGSELPASDGTMPK